MGKMVSILFFFVFPVYLAFSQNCAVKVSEIAGKYTGGCRSGKAHGKGTATGEDTYSGDFKDGYPNGFGKYTWKNGSWYEGYWDKGKRSGEGIMHYYVLVIDNNDSTTVADSVQKGYWKRDKFVGILKYKYEVHYRSSGISSINISEREANSSNEITIFSESISGGTNSALGFQYPKPAIGSIDVKQGLFMSQISINNYVKKNSTTLRGVEFPFRARISIGSEILDFEIVEEGNWLVEVKIQQ